MKKRETCTRTAPVLWAGAPYQGWLPALLICVASSLVPKPLDCSAHEVLDAVLHLPAVDVFLQGHLLPLPKRLPSRDIIRISNLPSIPRKQNLASMMLNDS